MTRHQENWRVIGTIIVVGTYIVLSGTMPISLTMNQGYDDGLFVRLATSMSHGDWLGPYDQLTLVKGPGYPLFIAINSISGIPINISEPVVYIFACIYLSAMISLLYRNSNNAYFVFLMILVLSPAIYISKGRITREFFYGFITIMVISMWIKVFIHNHKKISLMPSMLTGVVMVIFIITREESIWVFPTLIAISIFPFVQSEASGWRRCLGPATANIAIVVLSAAAGFGALKMTNYIKYGSTDVIEMTSSHFQRAMRQLQRVGAPYDRAYLPVPEEARRQIYAVSPSFATLHDHLEGRPNAATCKILPDTCGDIAGGWFMWAFRDAAAKAGYHKSATTAARFYEAVAKEISSACNDGKLFCASYMPPLIPHVSREQWKLIPDRLARSILLLHYAVPFAIEPPPSVPNSQDASALAILNNPPLVTADGAIQLSAPRLGIYGIWKEIIYVSSAVMRYMIIMALIVAALCIMIDRSRMSNPVYYIISALIIGIISRTVILVLVDISSFPTIYYPRFSTTGVLVSAATALSVIQGVAMLGEKWQGTFRSSRDAN